MHILIYYSVSAYVQYVLYIINLIAFDNEPVGRRTGKKRQTHYKSANDT
jgi:hypothetical protein